MGSKPPKRAIEADFAEVRGGLGRFSSLITAVESARVPPAGEPPQRREVHDLAPLVRGADQPCVDTAFIAEDALMATGVYDVVPHVRGRHEEMRNMRAVGRRRSVDHPRVRRVAGRAARGDENVWLAFDQVRDGE